MVALTYLTKKSYAHSRTAGASAVANGLPNQNWLYYNPNACIVKDISDFLFFVITRIFDNFA